MLSTLKISTMPSVDHLILPGQQNTTSYCPTDIILPLPLSLFAVHSVSEYKLTVQFFSHLNQIFISLKLLKF